MGDSSERKLHHSEDIRKSSHVETRINTRIRSIRGGQQWQDVEEGVFVAYKSDHEDDYSYQVRESSHWEAPRQKTV